MALDDEQRTIARTFETADALSLHYCNVADRVLKLLVFFGVVMTLAYEAYSRMWPIREMLSVYLGAFAWSAWSMSGIARSARCRSSSTIVH